MAINITGEMGDVAFQPAYGMGEYHVFYMPHTFFFGETGTTTVYDPLNTTGMNILLVFTNQPISRG